MKPLFGALLLVVFLTGNLVAADVETLDSLVREALQNNPEIKASKAKWQASTKRPSQEGSLPDPNIWTSWQNVNFDNITLDDIPNSMLRFSFSQEIPFPGKLSLKEQIATEQSQAEEKSYQATVRKVIADLKEAYYTWFLIDKSIEITLKNKDLLEKFVKIAETKYAVGMGIQQDVLKAQVEVSRFMEQLDLLREQKGISEAKIRSILNRPPEASLGKPEEVTKTQFILSLDELYELAKDRAPLLKVDENLIEKEEKAVRLAKKEYFPDFIVGAGAGIMGNPGDGTQGIWETQLGVKVPLYFWRKQKFGVEETVSRLQAAKEDFTSTNQELFFRIKDNYLVAKTSENLLKLYKEGIIPQSTSSLESAIAGYQVGDIDFLTLLDNIVTIYNFELSYYTHLTNYQISLARIEEIIDMSVIK